QVYRPFYQVPPRRSVTVTAGAPQDLGITKLTSTVAYFGKVSGLVKDEAGNPVDGAVAQLDPPVTDSQFTDATGNFTLDRILPGEYRLTIAAGGFKPVIVPVMVDNKPNFTVTLPEAITLTKGNAKTEPPAIKPLDSGILKPEIVKPLESSTSKPKDPLPLPGSPTTPPTVKPVGEEDLPVDPLPKPGAMLPQLAGNPNVRLFRPDPSLKLIDVKLARAVAERYLTSHIGPNGLWAEGARLAAGEPLALRDGFNPTAPGAYEFLVEAKGGPAGHIVVNTSKEMVPVPESSSEGQGHRASLLESFRQTHKREPKVPVFYRFSTFSWALEDGADRKFAKLAVDDFSFDAFRGGKRDLMELPGQRELIKRLWTAAETGAAPPKRYGLNFWGTDYYSKNLTGVPQYTQHSYNGCAVGCGPTAWGMVYGYWEGRGIDTIAGASSGNTSDNANTRAMMEKINGYVKTTCSGSSGGTMWYDEPDGQKWGDNDRGLTVGVAMRYMSDYSEFSMFKHLKSAINDGKPPMLGFYDTPNTNGGGHAVTGYGYWQKDAFGWWDDVETMRVNSGWSSPRTLNLTLGDNGLVLKWVMRVSVNN
ncbi:MAG: carboxypeptidase regulatory-like domain-containing protein, partial [Candidatus Sericytochromatia bacterium]|nr:carboxypeptidase regulatory-like domain-containing protein [Candidatus Sericytochromatia bacterium]